MPSLVRPSLVLAVLAACADPIGPRLEIVTADLALGDLRCAASGARTLELANTGDEPLELDVTSTLEEVVVSPATAVIEPGQHHWLEVTASAPAAATPGTVSRGDLVIATNAPGDDRTHALPVSFRVTGVAIVADAAIDFGQLLPGDAAMRTLAVTATGRGEVTLGLGAAAPFAVMGPSGGTMRVGDDDPADPFGVFERRFQLHLPARPTVGPVAADLPLTVTGDVCGAPPPPVALTAAVTSHVVTFDRTAIDFGTVPCAGHGLIELAITNHGEQPTDFATTLTDPRQFILAMTPTAGTLEAGQTQKIAIAHVSAFSKGILPGPVLANLDVRLNGGAVTRALPIRGFASYAILDLSTRVFELGDVRRGTTVTRSFTIANTGNLATGVSMFTSSGITISPLSFQLAPSASRTITISVTPQQPIGTTFELFMNADGDTSCQPLQVVTVRGRVVAP